MKYPFHLPKRRGLLALSLLFPASAFASESSASLIDLTHHPVGYIALLLFILAYAAVMAEEFVQLRKSKPVILAAGIIWAMVGYMYTQAGHPELAEAAIEHDFLEYAELMLFLLVAMTYINAMQERQVFDALRSWLIRKGFGFRTLFWLTGTLAFLISPVADNLTTALLLCAVVMAVGGDNARFVTLSCINIVVAANAGGAFSPFGDITTLMVWQKGMIDFFGFFQLFLPSLAAFLAPAILMQSAVPDLKPNASDERVYMKRGALIIVALFFLTIVTAVTFHQFLNLPPVIGMMTGLAYLQFFGFYLRMTHHDWHQRNLELARQIGEVVPFDVFTRVARAEWDTLLFFYGVVLCVGGLGQIGYLAYTSDLLYTHLGPTAANVSVGLLSAIVDNIPIMFAVLTMNPPMNETQWLLVTLTAGIGGSLLSIGSAAGVALMGQAHGVYTFASHLKWTPAIAVGYVLAILVHLVLNG